jgi:hypothetical protein
LTRPAARVPRRTRAAAVRIHHRRVATPATDTAAEVGGVGAALMDREATKRIVARSDRTCDTGWTGLATGSHAASSPGPTPGRRTRADVSSEPPTRRRTTSSHPGHAEWFTQRTVSSRRSTPLATIATLIWSRCSRTPTSGVGGSVATITATCGAGHAPNTPSTGSRVAGRLRSPPGVPRPAGARRPLERRPVTAETGPGRLHRRPGGQEGASR